MAKTKKMKDNRAKMSLKGPAAKTFVIVVLVLLVLYVLSQVLVLGWGLITSFKSAREFNTPISNIVGFPDINGLSHDAFWKLENYTSILDGYRYKDTKGYYNMFGTRIVNKCNATIWEMILNSLLYILIAGGLQTLVPCVVAYMCAKYKYWFSKFVSGLVVVLLSVHIIGAEPAAVQLLRDLSVYDTFWGQAMQHFTFLGMYYLVFLAYFEGMSDGYSEAAEIDGASQLRIMLSISLPLAAKMITTIFLLRTVSFWNDYHTPLMYMPTKPTLALGIYDITSNSTVGTASVPQRVAGSMVLAIPMTLLFVIFKDKLMGNVTMGGLKE